MEQLIGIGVALVTPFREDLSVDVAALERIVEHNIQGGVDYLVVLGTTAESATLSQAEKQLVVDIVVRTNAGRLPLVLGVGGNNTMAVASELKTLDLSEVDAILSVSPYYNKPTQEGIYQHFKMIAEASPIPIVLYNVPSRTGSNMLPETTLRLAHDFSNIVGIKEACGNSVQIDKIIKNKPEGFLVISGDDATALPTVLAGGAGVISVLGQGLPTLFSDMIKLGLEGNAKEAYGIHHKLSALMSLIFEEGNPAGIKSIFENKGISRATVRLPLVEATPALKEKISASLKSLDRARV
ncbi:4-hydroxy-tetrahydrodipicolinate synthase [Flagellimonas halotolerans]|uniref:4-hydroxy-tetrahydrodipicolinate synthase n=1 Tax=Flagellimonas halotolerans TaxID=3112164 RepID=A0ABU6IUN0_9FLAO|nr:MULTISPECIES: 4-hydroxy-tetrahydrodipicolinate synthase [unclassified Allomuricauda]MEC3966972.1 4-hydroxy-tetrahydrodipicolinate synthase [Muricauda sp. SYSU M86414]MEC4266835.1 4-hydroxy-tetrahydrodipicolinate synthase [Muricauda sp. SYSU M84420]